MKIPINWLKEYINIKDSPESLADKLTMSGTEIEAIDFGTSSFSGVLVGEILEIKKHPNADKLQIAIVNAGKEKLQIVCGAPNIKIGQKVPVALIGTKLGEFEIKKINIREVNSSGMMCSEAELGISDDHTGIMILDTRAKVGEELGKVLDSGEVVLDAEITPNRGDCLSIIGIAREVAAVNNKKLKIQKTKVKEINKKTSDFVEVKVEDKDLCPHYIARVVEGLKVGPSPKWMQDRLFACGIRPINNIVDATNYVMFEWGQPLHAFDFSKLSKNKLNKAEIIVRKAKKGEKLATLDGIERKLNDKDLVIADPSGSIAVAGVMGGANTEVDNDTKTIVLESATFDPTSVRKTAQKFNLRSEASNRFEKNIPMPLNEIAIDRAAELLTEVAGGKILEGRVDVLSKWIWIQHIGLKVSRLEEFLGKKIPVNEVIKILRSLGFKAEKFDIVKEAKKHLGKPYKYGANFKEDGVDAFDCSYLTDYLYSQINQFVGYTSLAQYELGKPIKDNNLQSGDILFIKGHINKSVTDHYFIPKDNDGYKKIILDKPKEVGHNGIYVGEGKVVHARHYQYDNKTKKWVKVAKEGEVVEESIDVYLKNPEYLGARRYVENINDWIAVTVPWWRLDVKIEEDLIEEIARIYGYNNFPSTLPSGKLPESFENKEIKWTDLIKDILVGAGFFELYNYSFVSKEILEKFNIDSKNCLKIANPLSSEQGYMKTSLVPSLLVNVLKNESNFESFKIFELAKIYQKQKELPKEIKFLAGALVNPNDLGIKYKNGKEFYSVKGVIELLFEKLGIVKSDIDYKEASIDYLHPGRSAEILIKNKKIGEIGEIHPEVVQDFGLKNRVAVFNINFSDLLNYISDVKAFSPISKYPTVVRDLAIVVDEKITTESILVAIQKSDKLIKGVKLFDVYTKKELKNKKSLAFRVIFGLDTKTLSEDEINSAYEKIVKILEKKGAKIRK